MDGQFFQEFLIGCPLPPSELNERLLKHKIIGGLDVSEQSPNGMLLCVTEINSKDEIERLAAALEEIGSAA